MTLSEPLSSNDDLNVHQNASFTHVYFAKPLAKYCPLSNHDAVTSPCTTPRSLLYYRLLCAVYCSITLLTDVIRTAVVEHNNNFKFFTTLTFAGLTVYFILSAFHSYQYVKRGSLPEYNVIYRWIYWHLFALDACYHIIVPLVFWALLSGKVSTYESVQLWASITMHGGDFIMMATDLFLCNTLMAWIQLPVVVLLALLYLTLAAVVHAIEGAWVYAFLDSSISPVMTGVTIPGIAILCVLSFTAAKYVCKRRRKREPNTEAVIEMV